MLRRCALAILVSVLAVPATAAADPVLVAAGDVACAPGKAPGPTTCQQAATGRLLSGASAVAMLGDGVYPSGSLDGFRRSYDPAWGAEYLARSRPVPGNHEYETAGAAGYFDYFGARAGARGRGYYSWDLGAWHIVALNSNCSA